jgi:hypothetical protein
MGSGVITVFVALVFAGAAATPGFSQRLVPAQGQDRPEIRLEVFDELFGRVSPPRARPRMSAAIPLPRPAPANARAASVLVAPDLVEGISTSDPVPAPRAESATVAGELPPAKAETEALDQLVEFRADHASIGQALAALAASVKLTYKLPPNIDRNLKGSYSGSLRAVLARILDGTDYFVKTADDEVRVIVLGTPGSSAAPIVSASAAPRQAAASAPPLASFLNDN